MNQEDVKIFQNVSKKLGKITIELTNLSTEKNKFVEDIDEKVDELYEKMADLFDSKEITIKNMSEKFDLRPEYLQLVLFQEHRSCIEKLTQERLYDYLKVKRKIESKNDQKRLISEGQIQKFVHIVENEIEILAETHEIFVSNSSKVDKIFEEIDFFSNQYIDCESLTEFFKHYSPDESFDEKGCSLLIKLIKGTDYSRDKLFYEDLIEFIQNKVAVNHREFSCTKDNESKEELSNRTQINYDETNNNKYFSVQQEKYVSGFDKNRTNVNKEKLIRKESSPDKSLQESIYDEKLMELSMSQSLLSPTSVKNNNSQMFDSIFNAISSNLTPKKQKLEEKISTEIKEKLSEEKKPKIFNEVDYIKAEDEYELKHESKVNTESKIKEKFSILHQKPLSEKFKGFYQEKTIDKPLNIKFEETKIPNRSNEKNNFETNLIRSHSRNLAYLAQVKLMKKKSIPKEKEKINNVVRPCLEGKISVFEKKKIEFFYSLVLICSEYEKWYNAIVELISHNDKFNFVNAFNVIDVKETNCVSYNEFLEFLNDCGIEKTPEKIEFFFHTFSQLSEQFSEKDTNKENIKTETEDFSNFKIEETLEQKRVMKFSNFIKMFCLNKAIPLVLKCKQRSATIQMKWSDKMRKNYCNFLRFVIDAVFTIEDMKKYLKRVYLEMKEIWKEETFEKTFGREILRFEEMQNILKTNCTVFLCELSRDDEYIDEEKLFKYLSVEEKELY